MTPLEPLFRLNWERIEAGLALLVVFLVGFWTALTRIPPDTDWTPAVDLFVLPLLLAPGALALVVFLGSVTSVVRLASALVTSGDRLRQTAFVALGIVGSVLYGVIGAYTLWWATASFYVIYFGDPGGVLAQPLVVVGLGTVLCVLVLLRVAIRHLLDHEVGPPVENVSS